MYISKKWLALSGLIALGIVAVVLAFMTVVSVPNNVFDTSAAPNPIVTPASNIVSLSGMNPGDKAFGYAEVTSTNGDPAFTYTITGVPAPANGLSDVLNLSIWFNGSAAECVGGTPEAFFQLEAFNGPITSVASNLNFANIGSAGDVDTLCFVVTLPASETGVGGLSTNIAFDFEAIN